MFLFYWTLFCIFISWMVNDPDYGFMDEGFFIFWMLVGIGFWLIN